MKARTLALTGAAVCFLSEGAAADFTFVTSTNDINPDPDLVTVQVFATFDNPLDTLLAVGGIPGLAPVVFHSSSPLINDDGPFAGTKAADFPGFPLSGMFDSWVSINQHTFADGDTDYSPDFAGVPTAEQAILGSHWEEDDGGWFDSEPSTPEQGASMIIAQFTFEFPEPGGSTLSATLSGLVNWVPAGSGGGFVSSRFDWSFHEHPPPPAPGAIALLVIAGLAHPRPRRR